MQTEPKSDTDLVVKIFDGPEDKPNFWRHVKLVCWDSVPNMVIVEDTKTGEILRVHRQKIEQAKLDSTGSKP